MWPVMWDLLPAAPEIVLRCSLCPPPYHHPHFGFNFLFYQFSILLLPHIGPLNRFSLKGCVMLQIAVTVAQG